MSANLELHISNVSLEDSQTSGVYTAGVILNLDRWVSIDFSTGVTINGVPIQVEKPDMPINTTWVGHSEVRSVDDCKDELIFITYAGSLKKVKFHEDNWHPSRITNSLATSAFIQSLPDTWPIVLWYI